MSARFYHIQWKAVGSIGIIITSELLYVTLLVQFFRHAAPVLLSWVGRRLRKASENGTADKADSHELPKLSRETTKNITASTISASTRNK